MVEGQGPAEQVAREQNAAAQSERRQQDEADEQHAEKQDSMVRSGGRLVRLRVMVRRCRAFSAKPMKTAWRAERVKRL